MQRCRFGSGFSRFLAAKTAGSRSDQKWTDPQHWKRISFNRYYGTAPIYSFYSRLLLFTPVSTRLLLKSWAVSENCYLSSAGRGPVVRPVAGRPIGGELCHQHLPQVRRQGNGDHQRAEVEESHSRRYRWVPAGTDISSLLLDVMILDIIQINGVRGSSLIFVDLSADVYKVWGLCKALVSHCCVIQSSLANVQV